MNRRIEMAQKVLKERNISFKTNNGGIHLMISSRSQRVDFWPTTGKWIAHGFRDVPGQGLEDLLTYVASKDVPPQNSTKKTEAMAGKSGDDAPWQT